MFRSATAALAVSVLALAAGGPVPATTAASLFLKVTGAGGGVALSTGHYMGTSPDGYQEYRVYSGATMTLTASSSAAGTTFAQWLGACGGSVPICRVTIDEAKVVVARFSPVRLYVGLTLRQGSVTLTPTGTICGAGCFAYPYGARVRLDAKASSGYAFKDWMGACAGSSGATCYVTLWDTVDTTPSYKCTSNPCLGASQSPLSRDVKASVTVSGRGHVYVGSKDCKGTCSYTWQRGQLVSLRAFPSEGARFLKWDGACTGSKKKQCTVAAFQSPNGDPPSIVAKFSG